MTNVVVIDYGVCNLKSVQRGLEKVGASVQLSSDPEVIATAERLVLPGVGAFEDGMKGLNAVDGVIQAIDHFVQKGKPLLGICLGMQMLLDASEEYGLHTGLGYIPGVVKKIPSEENNVCVRKIPHIGWSQLIYPESRQSWNNTTLSRTKLGEYSYFVHSYMAIPKHDGDLLAQCEYENIKITAAIKKENITGFQFHPEKSGKVGLTMLDAFLCE